MKLIAKALIRFRQQVIKNLTLREIKRCESVMLSRYSSQQDVHNAAVRLCKLRESGEFVVPLKKKQ